MPVQYDNTPMVSVIIPSIRGGSNLSRLLDEIDKQTFKDLETLVIKGVGPNGRARNEGVRKAKGKYLVFIDDDVVLGHERVIANLISPLELGGSIGMTGASVLLPEDPNWLQRSFANFRGWEFPVVKEIVDSDSAQHSCCALPKEVYKNVGWESDDLITGTDNDLRMRLHRLGYRVVVVPDTWVYHLTENTLPSIARKLFMMGMGSAYALKVRPEIFGYSKINICDYQIKTAVGALLYTTFSAFPMILLYLFTLRVFRLLVVPIYTTGYLYGWFKFYRADSTERKTQGFTSLQPSTQLGIIDKSMILIIKALYGAPNALLIFLEFILFGKDCSTAKDTQKILLYRTGNIGDIVCAVPSMIAIRRQFPTARITLLTTPGRRGLPGADEILSRAWYIDNIKTYYPEDFGSIKKVYNLVKELRHERCDLFIALPWNFEGFSTLVKKMIFAKALGVSGIMGFRVRTIKLFARTQSRLMPAKGEVEALLNLLQSEGVSTNRVEFDLPISEEDKNVVDGFLPVSSEEGKSLTVAINPGAKIKSKQWPIERFAQVGKEIKERFGAQIVVTGSQDDKEKAIYLKNNIGNDVVITAGMLRILQTAELLKRCDLLISNDTGATHLAAAGGTPAVVIFCPRYIRGQWHPYGYRNVVLRGHASCDHCFRFECNCSKCTEPVTVEEVLRACESILGRLKKGVKL